MHPQIFFTKFTTLRLTRPGLSFLIYRQRYIRLHDVYVSTEDGSLPVVAEQYNIKHA